MDNDSGLNNPPAPAPAKVCIMCGSFICSAVNVNALLPVQAQRRLLFPVLCHHNNFFVNIIFFNLPHIPQQV